MIATIKDAVKDFEKKTGWHDLCQNKPCPSKFETTKNEREQELQSDTSIVILPAGKGRSTVILNLVDYLEKCMKII